jgi:polysaccharide biosynthesis transport protein
MSQSTGELLGSAFRRAIPLIIGLVVMTAGAVNLQRQLSGPVYSADARVLLSTVDLGAIVAGVQPGYVDPQRVMENALTLARSPQLYDRASARVPGLSATELQEMTSVEGSEDADLLLFSAEAGDEETATAAVNAVAREYPLWRADVTAGAIRGSIRTLREQLSTAPETERTALQADLRQLEVLESLTTGNTVLVEESDEAVQTSPKPVRDSVLGAAIGLMTALLIAGAREILDTRVRSESEAEEILDAPSIATIASIPRRAQLVTVGHHEARFGDSYALLAANVVQLNPESGPTVVAITSATEDQGKTITASNLAVALAQRGERVILADFDLRRPSIASVFKLPPDAPGVIQAVRGGATAANLLQRMPLNGDAPSRKRSRRGGNGSGSGPATGSLRILPAGGVIRGALSHSPEVRDLIEGLSAQADTVIIDTPPALSTPEMAELSDLVDVILVVVRQGRATQRSLRALHRQSQNWRAAIAGLVITDSDASDTYYGYAQPASQRPRR